LTTQKNDFAEESKFCCIYRFENDFVGTLKIISNAVKNFHILATSFSILHNYFDSSTKLHFWHVSISNFRSFSKTVLSVYVLMSFK